MKKCLSKDSNKIFLKAESYASIMTSWKEKSLNNLRNFSTRRKLSSSACTESSSTLCQKKESIEKKLELCLNEIKEIQKELKNTKCDDENFIVYKCQLYELITNITWDLNSLPDEVKGYVSKPLNVFNMNNEVQSSYDITKDLWDLISGEVETLCASP